MYCAGFQPGDIYTTFSISLLFEQFWRKGRLWITKKNVLREFLTETTYCQDFLLTRLSLVFMKNQLKILLLRFRHIDAFALPGGFIYETENLGEAAGRILTERTGLHHIYLEQFYVFGDRDRRDSAVQKTLLEGSGIQLSADHWLMRRFVSIGYYA